MPGGCRTGKAVHGEQQDEKPCQLWAAAMNRVAVLGVWLSGKSDFSYGAGGVFVLVIFG